MYRQTRRSFLQKSAGGIVAGSVLLSARSYARVVGANDRIRVGVAGIHGRGQAHINEFLNIPGVEVAYLIDPDKSLFERLAARVKERSGLAPNCVQDIREVLKAEDCDAIAIATTNHWHALMTFWACQHKKHVYVEKPCSHNVFEGRQCVRAAEKYGVIVQHGTQSRSSTGWARTVAAVASGKYGKLIVAKAYASKPRWSIGFKPVTDPPPHLDYNLWLGPAPWLPYHENLVHYNWHWFWETGNGEIGNQGVHQMDIARWAITAATGKAGPKRVISIGDRWVDEPTRQFKDQGQTPNMHLTVFDFDGVLLVFEIVGLVGKKGADGQVYPQKVDNEFITDEGILREGRFFPKGSDKPVELKVDVKPRSGNPFRNFIDCIRSGRREDLDADILDGHLSSALCHLGNISWRLGHQVPGTTKPDFLGWHEEVAKSWDVITTTLKGTLGLDIAKTTYQLGAELYYDAEKEKFVNNPEADKLLTRDYREPFVVTKEV